VSDRLDHGDPVTDIVVEEVLLDRDASSTGQATIESVMPDSGKAPICLRARSTIR
jgi:hypothetical protein